MISSAIEPVRFTGPTRFFMNDFVQLGERVTFEWVPTTERRAVAAIGIVAGLFAAVLIVCTCFAAEPLDPSSRGPCFSRRCFEEPASFDASEDRPIADRNHLPRPGISA